MFADLHVHTSASDGTESPQQVVLRAGKTGLKVIAITDHDTVDGIAPAVKAGREILLEVIPGVELSTEYQGKEIHILGYMMDLSNRDFLDHLLAFRQDRLTRIKKMVSKLNEMDISVTLEQVLTVAGKGSVGRPHLARAMVDLGAAGSIEEAFERYIGINRPAYVPRLKYSPGQAVKLICRAKGVPVLAHPGLYGCDELIPRLVNEGLQGIEVYYPRHCSEEVERYLDLCKKYNLIATGGSDYHGKEYKEHGRLGETTVSYSTVEDIKRAAGFI